MHYVLCVNISFQKLFFKVQFTPLTLTSLQRVELNLINKQKTENTLILKMVQIEFSHLYCKSLLMNTFIIEKRQIFSCAHSFKKMEIMNNKLGRTLTPLDLSFVRKAH